MNKPAILALTLMLVAGCSGGGQTVASGPHTCPAFSDGIITYPATQPPDGARGVSPAIGSIVVPFVAALIGQTAILRVSPPVGSNAPDVVSSPFVQSGATLVATIPPLAANTTYFMSVDVLVSAGTGPLGCDVLRLYVLGSFTTR